MTAIYDPNTGQWTTRPGLMGAAPAGTAMGPGGTYLNAPTRSQTVQGRVDSLSRSDSDLMRRGAKSGEQFVANRGLLNSTLGAQAGRAGALASVLPIATADAQMSAQANAQNAEALNAVNIANLNRQSATSVGGAYVGPNAIDSSIDFERKKEIMRLQSQLNREEGREDRDWRSGESAADRAWRSGESELDRGLTREEWASRRAEQDAQRAVRAAEQLIADLKRAAT